MPAKKANAKREELGSEENQRKIKWAPHEVRELNFGTMLGRAYAAAVLAVYVQTMHPTVAGGDSGELMGAACELG